MLLNKAVYRMSNPTKLEIFKNGKMKIIIIINCHNSSGKLRKFIG